MSTNVNTIDPALLEEMRAGGLLDETLLASLISNEPSPVATIDLDDMDLDSEIEAALALTAGPDALSALATPITAIETVEPAIESVDVELIDAQIDREDAREAIYVNQTSATDVIPVAEIEPMDIAAVSAAVDADSDPKPKKARVAKKAAGTTVKRVARLSDGGSMGSYFERAAGSSQVELAPGSFFDIAVLVDSMAKKIGEKAINVADTIYSGKTLSVFTKVGLALMREHTALHMKDMVDALSAGSHGSGKPYSIGTARSQAQQIVSLFHALRITNTDGSANSDSVLLAKLTP